MKAFRYAVLSLISVIAPDAAAQPILFPGNGHFYERVNVNGISWETARQAAASRIHNGVPGHLVSITTVREQMFLQTTFGNMAGLWLGGAQAIGAAEPGGGWGWITAEPWIFTNWGSTEPSDSRSYRNLGNEDRLQIGAGGSGWNDMAGINDVAGDTRGYIVEFDVSSTPVIYGENGHAYTIVDAPNGLAWDEANIAAAQVTAGDVAGHLATVTSSGEQSFLEASFGFMRGLWIGGLQTRGAGEPAAGWTWVTDEPWVFSAWGAGEPNDLRSHFQGLNEDRLQIGVSGSRWNDLANLDNRATDAFGFVVEFEPCPFVIAYSTPAPVCNGDSIQLTIVASGGLPIEYEWFKDGELVTSATGPTLRIAQVSTESEGAYRCLARNSCGSDLSQPIQVRVCIGEFNCDGGVDGRDVADFFAAWEAGDLSSDVNGDGGIDGADVQVFFDHWENGC